MVVGSCSAEAIGLEAVKAILKGREEEVGWTSEVVSHLVVSEG